MSNNKKSNSVVTAASNKPEVIYDRPFNPHRAAKTQGAQDLIKYVLKLLDGLDVHRQWIGSDKARKRARRKVDQVIYEHQVEALVSDLITSHLTNPAAWVRVSRRNQDLGGFSNYKPAFITQKLVEVMDSLALPEMDFISIELGGVNDNPFAMTRDQARGTQTKLRSTKRLVDLAQERGLSLSDFGLDPSEEVIHLKGKKQGTGIWAEADLITYEDTDKTRQMRADLRRINESLERADIDLGSEPTKPVDINQRRLRRVFNNGDWESHGRFQGGFWINLARDTRRDLFMDGELTADLDFGQMNPRLLYAEVGVKPTFDDAYAVPGLERHRDGVKKLLNSLIAASKPLKRFPKEVRQLLPPVIHIDGEMRSLRTVEEAVDLISEFHKPIASMFCMGLANRLMYRESEIMNKVLLALLDEGITALPIHDGLLVAQSKAEGARGVMLEVFKSMTGFDGVVSID